MLSPLIQLHLGFILKELGVGIDITSTNFTYMPTYSFSFNGGYDGGGASTFTFDANTKINASALKTNLGPISVSAWNDDLARLRFLEANINMENGDSSINFTPSLQGPQIPSFML